VESQSPFSTHAAHLFAEKYSKATSEKQLGQSFWRDFFTDVCGISDLLTTGVEFEYPVRLRATQSIGFADVFWPGVLLVEHKSKGFDLDKAEHQAREYLVSLDPSKKPPVFIVCDFSTFRIVEVYEGTSIDFPLAELPQHLHRFESILRGYINGVSRVEVSADLKAAELMGKLYVEFEKAGFEGHEVSVFLVRILFIFFAEDSHIFKTGEKGLFEALLESTSKDGAGLGGLMQELFQVLNTPREKRPTSLHSSLVDFPYVNGGLFQEPLSTFSFTPEMRRALVSAGQYDWSQISPAIFGSMIQTVQEKEARRQLGEHYTSETNIMKSITPLFLNDFHERLRKAWDSAPALKRFRAELGTYQWLDPAAGSGNYLLISYKRLRELELKLLARLQDLEGEQAFVKLDGSWGVTIHLSQFHGIEYKEWSSQIARVAMFLAEHQANLAQAEILGSSPALLPLSDTAHIQYGNALRVDWADICPMTENTFIIGNPPFYGARWQSPEQKRETLDTWKDVKGAGDLDYVSNWFLIAARHISKSGARAAFVATNSLTQGLAPAIIWGQLAPLGIGIDFAHRTFAWNNDAPGMAAVHCVIIGFSSRPKPKTRQLWTYATPTSQPTLVEAKNINAYLLDAQDILISARSTPLSTHSPRLDNGNMPNDGGFLSNISDEEARDIRKKDPVAAKYLKRLMGAQELIHDEYRYCLWLVDATPSEIRSSPILAKRVKAVKDLRSRSRREVTKRLADRPAEFGEIRQPKAKYIAIPRITSELREYVPIAINEPDIIINDKISYIADASLSTFGVISSKPFNVWNKAVSGRTKNDTLISNSITFNNFPFPAMSEGQKHKVANAAEEVLSARQSFPDSSLADLYDKSTMPPVLRKAHLHLDQEVLNVFGLGPKSSDETILEHLFDLYVQATATLFDEFQPKKGKKRDNTIG